MTGRPRSCSCGTCFKCLAAEAARLRYQSLSKEERQALVSHRDQTKVRASDKRRTGTQARRASALASSRRQRVNNPAKYKARTAVNNAVRDGRLTKQPCESCGSEKVEGHHDDYARPLDVRWFCRPCHKAFHGHLRPDYQSPQVHGPAS